LEIKADKLLDITLKTSWKLTFLSKLTGKTMTSYLRR